METAEKLRTILKNLEGKKLSPAAFHLDELVETKSSNPEDFDDEWYYCEYQIGRDKLKLYVDVEDFSPCLSISLNGECKYDSGYIGALIWDEDDNDNDNDNEEDDNDNEIEWEYEEYSDYDKDAEALFEIIMQHGGVLEEEASKIRAIFYGEEKQHTANSF